MCDKKIMILAVWARGCCPKHSNSQSWIKIPFVGWRRRGITLWVYNTLRLITLLFVSLRLGPHRLTVPSTQSRKAGSKLSIAIEFDNKNDKIHSSFKSACCVGYSKTFIEIVLVKIFVTPIFDNNIIFNVPVCLTNQLKQYKLPFNDIKLIVFFKVIVLKMLFVLSKQDRTP